MWSDEEIVKKLRRLLASKGYLSETLMLRTRGLPAPSTLHNHFGTYRQLYKAVGYKLPEQDLFRGPKAEASMRLRRKLVKRLCEIFPEHLRITSLPLALRSILEVDHEFLVGILVCISCQRPGEHRFWVVRPTRTEREHITLVCKANPARTRISSYHLLPNVDIPGTTHLSYNNQDALLRSGITPQSLFEFYDAVLTLRRRIGFGGS